MNVIYLCKLSKYQSQGNQIDIPKKIAQQFFGTPENFESNFEINVCHANNPKVFETIEIQHATNLRFSTKLNSLLAKNGDKLGENDFLVVEKLGLSYCVHLIKTTDDKYKALNELFEDEEKHMLLSATLDGEPKDTENVLPQYRPYITAIKSKPFLLLAGISGTGKSRIVRELARACWAADSDEYAKHKPSNYEMVQVKPNWHDSSELIGYVSRVSGQPIYVAGPFLKFIAKAWEHTDIPYFLCLDEMNLAPVEQYFAEYLSVIESRKAKDGVVVTDPIIEKVPEQWYFDLVGKLTEDGGVQHRFMKEGITIPENLIVVGTVNMDETTFSFSRKVLDRAMTIEMNEVNLMGGLEARHEQIGKLDKSHLIGTAVEGVDVYEAYTADCQLAINYLQAVNDQLEGTPFKVAYRTRNEFLLYVVNNLPYNKTEEGEDCHHGWLIARALDEITCMKVLTRIEGDETKVSSKFLGELKATIKTQLEALGECTYTGDAKEVDNDNDIWLSVSLAKIDEMTKRLASGYTSFWS